MLTNILMSIFPTVVIGMCILLLIRDRKFQPSFSLTKKGFALAWGSRAGLALICFAALHSFVDIWAADSSFSTFRSTFLFFALSLIFGRLCYKAIHEAELFEEEFSSSQLRKEEKTPTKISNFLERAGYTLAVLSTVSFFTFGQIVERSFFPFITTESITDVVRYQTQVCWTWTFVKNREGTPQFYGYWIEDGRRIHHDVLIVNADGYSLNSSQSRPVGWRGSQRLCAEIPENLRHENNLAIGGEIKYNTVHRLWPFYQEVTKVKVPDQIRAEEKEV